MTSEWPSGLALKCVFCDTTAQGLRKMADHLFEAHDIETVIPVGVPEDE